MANSPENQAAYAYELVNPYHPERGVSGTLVLDQPVRVGERLSRAFANPNPEQDPTTHERTITSGPEREWE